MDYPSQAMEDLTPTALQCPTSPHADCSYKIGPDASILLVGFRGVGKTTLAVLAANLIGFRLIDADQHFQYATGLSRKAYADKHGLEEYKAMELSLLDSILRESPERSIIVCGPGSVEHTGRKLIKDFAHAHPVVHIMRDAEDVQGYLCNKDTAKVSKLAEMIGLCYQSVSNYEYYNLSEPKTTLPRPGVGPEKHQKHPALLLKHTQAEFLRFIDAVRNQVTQCRTLQAHHSLSRLPPEARPYSYALIVNFKDVAETVTHLRSTDVMMDAVELVVDMRRLIDEDGEYNETAATLLTREYYTLRRSARVPVIFHLVSDDKQSARTISNYFRVLHHGLKLAPEYLAVDIKKNIRQIQCLVARKASTKIIGHHFDASPVTDAWNSPDRSALLHRAKALGCDLVRICQNTMSVNDNIGVQAFRARAKEAQSAPLPLIAYNVGSKGRSSHFTNRILTPVTLNRSPATDEDGSDQQFTVQSAQRALYASFMLDKLEFGIFGDSVTSAVSPHMHNAAFQACGMPHVYRTFETSSLQTLQHLFYRESFGGASISSPFKKDVMSLVDFVSPEARAIGAVNTVIPLRSDGPDSILERNQAGPVVALYGDNTDWIGIHTCITEHLSPVNAVRNNSTAIVLGAGGMARASLYALLRLGVKTVCVWNRTTEHVAELKAEFDGKLFADKEPHLGCSHPGNRTRQPGDPPSRVRVFGPVKIVALSSLDSPWPQDYEPPTIIVSCISRAGIPRPQIRLPNEWLKSRTGGVVVEVRLRGHPFTCRSQLTCIACIRAH